MSDTDFGSNADPPASGEAPFGPDADTGWHAVADVGELPLGAVREVVVGDQIVALAHAEDGVYAIDGMCAHQGGPLGSGRLEGCVLTCPWHGWQYDVRDGRQMLSERVRQRSYPVRVVGDTIWVQVGDA